LSLGELQSVEFGKQRRLLIAVSVALTAFIFLGGHVKERLEYSGFALVLDHPNRAVVGLWVAWLWALWRYGQHSYEQLSVLRGKIVEDIDAEDLRLANLAARSHAVREGAAGRLEERHDDIRVDPSTVRVAVLPTVDLEKELPQYFYHRDGGGRHYDRITGAYTFAADADSRGSSTFSTSMTMSGARVRRLRAHATIAAILRLPGATDYIAPFIIAAVPIAMTLVPWIASACVSLAQFVFGLLTCGGR
jgi:hypothetical protein